MARHTRVSSGRCTPVGSITEAGQEPLSQLAEQIAALASPLAKQGRAVSPQIAFVVAQEEQDLRAVEDEFGWLDSSGVAEQMGTKRTRTLASCMRARGPILGYVRRGQRAVRYPRFQFDGTRVLPVIPALIAIANERGVAHENLTFWLCSPNGMLECDARPVDSLRIELERVLTVARYEFA